MKNYRYLILGMMMFLLVLAACSSNKKIKEPVVIPPSPMELASAAADSASAAYESEQWNVALNAFIQSRDYYQQAMATAAPTDSVDVLIERTQINIALTNIKLAEENIEYEMIEDALSEYESAAAIYKELAPLTITADERDGYVSMLYRLLAKTAQDAGYYERALGYLDNVLNYEPGSEDVLKTKYQILKDNIKDTERAYKVLKDYAEASQDYKAYLILAESYKENGNNATAGTYYDKALELGQNADVFTRVADFYRTTGSYQKSNQVLEQFVATQPGDEFLALAYRVMAGNYDQLNNTAKKIEFYDKSLKIEPNADVALILANYYHGLKKWDQVISYATQVINLDAAKAAAFLLRGNAYYMKKNNAAAKADLGRIQNDPTYGKSAKDLLSKIK